MTTEAPSPTPAPTHGRRARRVSGEEREQAILATLERLLEGRALGEISVDDLARGAGISRPTFYFYFASKEAVLLSLLDRVVTQGRTERDRARQPQEPADTAARWRRGVESFLATFTEHRAVTLAVAEAAAGSAEVRELWAGVMGVWVEETATAIEAERDRGAAPGGLAARDLATALVSMNEQVVHRALSGQQPAVDLAGVTDLLVTIWLRAIYAADGPG
jgi:AcrR family transcriptional regulator